MKYKKLIPGLLFNDSLRYEMKTAVNKQKIPISIFIIKSNKKGNNRKNYVA